MTHKLPVLVLALMVLNTVGGCVSRPETPPVPPAAPTERTTINAPTVVNQPLPSGPQMSFQVTQDPNTPGRGWVLVGNQPVAVKLESGVWVFDTGPTSGQTPPSAPAPPAPPSGAGGGTASAPPPRVSPPTSPPGYMSPAVAQELLLIDRIELYRTLLARMKVLAANAQVNSVDEFNVMITRLESILREMERLQQNSQLPSQQQQSTQP